MFERFTRAARDAVVAAQQEARDMNTTPIGTQHVLLAMVSDEDGAVAAALRPYGVDEVFVRDQILELSGRSLPEPEPEPDRDAEDAAALKAIGIDLDAVRRAIEENFGPGALRLPPTAPPKRRGLLGRFQSGPPVAKAIRGHIPFSPRSKKVLELSLREALRLKHTFIAPEHLALGILREGRGQAAQILAAGKVDFVRLRADLTRALDDRAA